MENKMNFGIWYRKYLNKWIPQYGILALSTCFAVNVLIYGGTQIITKNTYHHDFTTGWDRKVPFVKEWVVIYLVCFAFWIINYILIAQEGKEQCYRFVSADLLSRIICGVFFIMLPTTNIRPIIHGTDFFSYMVKFVYGIDSATNLFPSIHCLVSWFCFIGIRKSKKVPLWYKVFSCIFAILVCASTQFTKQHYLIDIVGGILIAELCFYLTNHTQFYSKVEMFFDKVNQRIFGVEYINE